MLEKSGLISQSIAITLIALVLAIPLMVGYTFVPVDMLKWTSPWYVQDFVHPKDHIYIDVVGEHFPWKFLLSEQVARGQMPLWNPYNYFGTPFLALSSPQLLDVTNVLYLVFAPLVAFDFSMVLKLWMSGLFMLFLARYLRLSYWSALVAATAFMLNGAFIMNLPFGWMTGAWLWIPLVILFLQKSVEGGGNRQAVAAGVFLGLSHLGGHLQVTLQILVLLFLWFVYHMIALVRRRVLSGFWQAPMSIAISVGVSIGVAAIQLIPASELLMVSGGITRSYSGLGWFGEWPRNLLKIPFAISFLVPNFFGHHSTYSPVLITGEKWTSYMMGFIGFSPLMLAGVAMTQVRLGVVKLLRFIALGALVVVFLTPLATFLYFRTLIVWSFAAALLAGFGLDYLCQEANEAVLARFTRVVVGIFIVLVFGLIAAHWAVPILGNQFRPLVGRFVSENIGFGFAKQFYANKITATFKYYSLLNPILLFTLGIIAAFSAILLMFGGRKVSGRTMSIVVCLLTVLELIHFFFLYIPAVSLKNNPLYPETGSTRFLHADRSLYRAMGVVRPGTDPPMYQFESNIMHKIQMAHHQGSINNYRSWRFTEQLWFRAPGIRFDGTMASLANIKYLLTNGVDLDTSKYPLVYNGDIKIYENPRVLPRAFAVSSFRVLPSPEAVLKAMKSPRFDPGKEVLLEEEPLGIRLQDEPRAKKIAVSKYEPQYVRVRTEMDGSSLLVVTDTQYPGWTAFVDGVATRIYTADYLFRAIYVPKGVHTVEFRFQPASFAIGMWISFSTLLLAGIVVLVSALRASPRRPQEDTRLAQGKRASIIPEVVQRATRAADADNAGLLPWQEREP